MKSLFIKKNFYHLLLWKFILLSALILFSKPTSIYAWSSLYGQVYYTKPDGTKVGINGVGMKNRTMGHDPIHITSYSNGSLDFGDSTKLVEPGNGYFFTKSSPYLYYENDPYCLNAYNHCDPNNAPYHNGQQCVNWSCVSSIGCGCQIDNPEGENCKTLEVIAPPDMAYPDWTSRMGTRPTPPTSFPPGIPAGGVFYPVAPGVERTPNMAWLDQIACGVAPPSSCGGYTNGARYHVDFEYFPPQIYPCGLLNDTKASF